MNIVNTLEPYLQYSSCGVFDQNIYYRTMAHLWMSQESNLRYVESQDGHNCLARPVALWSHVDIPRTPPHDLQLIRPNQYTKSKGRSECVPFERLSLYVVLHAAHQYHRCSFRHIHQSKDIEHCLGTSLHPSCGFHGPKYTHPKRCSSVVSNHVLRYLY